MNGEQRETKAEADPAPPSAGLCVFSTGVLLGLVPIFSANLRQEEWLTETAILLRLLFTIVGSIAGVFLLRFLRPESGASFRLKRGHVRHFLGYGVISIALVNFLYMKSLDLAPASVAVFSVFAAAPTTTLIVTWLRKRAQPARRELGLIGFIIFGCLLVNHADGWSGSHWHGALMAALAGVCYGFYSIFGAKICNEYSAPCLLFWQFTFAGIATAAAYCLVPQYHAVFGQLLKLATAPTLAIWLPALGLGLGATFLPYLLYGLGLRRGLKETTASALTLMEPVSATVLAWICLNQVLGPWQFIGCLTVILASLALLRHRKPLSPTPKM